MTQKNRIIDKVTIIGAGLGGLATAIALKEQGIDVQIYEKAKKLRPAGGGLGLLPNGLNSLEAIKPELVEMLIKAGSEIKTTVFRKSTGEVLRRRITQYRETYEKPLLCLWWWQIQKVLASLLPVDIIHLDHCCEGFEQNEQSVTTYFTNGKKVESDILIGADGINSIVRKNLISDEKPRYLGSKYWRAVIKFSHELLPPHQLTSMKGEQKILYLLDVGNGYKCWTARTLCEEDSLCNNATEAKTKVLEGWGNWGEPVRDIIEATPSEQILEGLICDRLPLSHWSEGRVTLLGDAAHPMSPSAAQGANTTFEDAFILAKCLELSPNIDMAFKNYENHRLERTKRIQERSAIGERNYYKPVKIEQNTANTNQTESSGFSEFQDWAFSYNPTMIKNLIS